MATEARPVGKSPDAFRTISEVAAILETPAHVLRFWESKFPQVKPVKRAGGRRYYRPDDIVLLGGIKALLHEQGMTIRGVQKMLKERGTRYVASLSTLAWEEELVDEEPAPEEVIFVEEDAEDEPHPVIVGPWPGARNGEGLDPETAVTEQHAPQAVPLPMVMAEDEPPVETPDEPSDDAPDESDDSPEASPPPSTEDSATARLRRALARADRDRLRDKAAEIAPLVERLRALRNGPSSASA